MAVSQGNLERVERSGSKGRNYVKEEREPDDIRCW